MCLPELWVNSRYFALLWVIFCEVGSVYGSALQRFALIMGKC